VTETKWDYFSSVFSQSFSDFRRQVHIVKKNPFISSAAGNFEVF
jgi:hypothetical protein